MSGEVVTFCPSCETLSSEQIHAPKVPGAKAYIACEEHPSQTFATLEETSCTSKDDVRTSDACQGKRREQLTAETKRGLWTRLPSPGMPRPEQGFQLTVVVASRAIPQSVKTASQKEGTSRLAVQSLQQHVIVPHHTSQTSAGTATVVRVAPNMDCLTAIAPRRGTASSCFKLRFTHD